MSEPDGRLCVLSLGAGVDGKQEKCYYEVACQGNRPGFAFQEAKSLRVPLLDNRIGVVGNTPFTSGIRRDPGRRAGIRCEGGFAMQRICRWCGETFDKKASDVRRGGGIYCKAACVYAARRAPKDVSGLFWSKVDRRGPNECWPWTGKPNEKGYGRFCFAGQTVLAHRFAYELTHGLLPPGVFALHSCDNPPCCNLRHLWPGTLVDNNADMRAKGRGKNPPPPAPNVGRFTPDRMAGERHPFHKLTETEVRDIRQLRQAGWKLAPLAERFGVSQTVVSKIARHELWRCVEGDPC